MPSVTVNIAANIASLVTGMDRAERSINTFAKRAGRTFGNVAGAFGAVMGARQIANFVQGQAEAVDALGKTSDRLGVTTEQLTALQHAANLAGVDTGTLTTALQYMQRTIGSALAGEKMAVDSFKAIGLNAKALSTMGTHGSLLAVADAMRKVDNNAKKLKVTQEIFGRSGMGMVNVMENGSKAFKDAAIETERLGMAVNRVDAKKVEEMNDEFERTKSSLEGLGKKLIVELSGPLHAAATSATRVFSDINQIMAQARGDFGESGQLRGANATEKQKKDVAELRAEVLRLAEARKSAAQAVSVGRGGFLQDSRYKELTVATEEYHAANMRLLAMLKEIAEESPAAALNLLEINRTAVESGKSGINYYETFRQILMNAAKEQKNLTTAAKEYKAEQAALPDVLAEVDSAVDKTAQNIKDKFKDAFASALAEGEGFSKQLERLFTSLKYDFLKEAFGLNKAKDKSEAARK